MTKVKFKDVSHKYIGCKFLDTKTNEITTLTTKIRFLLNMHKMIDDIKPILRQFHLAYDDPTYVKFKHNSLDLGAYIGANHPQVFNQEYFKDGIHAENVAVVYSKTHESAFLYLNHFDCDGLIESGEAIDAATLTPFPYQEPIDLAKLQEQNYLTQKFPIIT